MNIIFALTLCGSRRTRGVVIMSLLLIRHLTTGGHVCCVFFYYKHLFIIFKMYSRPKRVKLNDDFINQLLEDSSDSLLSDFDDSDVDKTYNPISSSESDVLSGKKIYIILQIFIFYCPINCKKL